MDKKYCLLVKTGDAELRAMENTKNSVKQSILSLIELTRGRKVPSRKGVPEPGEPYPYEKKIERIKTIFGGCDIIFDVTSDEKLTSKQINDLYDPTGGYSNWVSFLTDLKDSSAFNSISPCIILDSEDDCWEDNLALQVEALSKSFDYIVYRNDIYDDFCYDDIEIIKQHLNEAKLLVVIDCSYVVQSTIPQYVQKVKARLSHLYRILPDDSKIVVSSTSFPNNISEIGDDRTDTFSLSEVILYQDIDDSSIIYSDYGSVNPIRNDNVFMARGWIPRIDVPLNNTLFYYRQRRPSQSDGYAPTYSAVAKQVVNDSRFPREMNDNWGVMQIIKCASGSSPSSQPSFWISVRMCIHLEMQAKRLGLL